MKVERDVIIDLLPVYFSGEASAATQALVEERFREDPELERIARSATRSVELLKVAPAPASDWEEKLALERARWEEKAALEKARERAEALYASGIMAFLMTVVAVMSQIRDRTLHLLSWTSLIFAAAACILWYVFWRARTSYALLSKSYRFRVWALFFTLGLLCFVRIQDHKIIWFFLTDHPIAGGVIATISIGLWVAFFVQRLREVQHEP